MPGGEKQIYIDFGHPDNRPIKEFIDKKVPMKKTNWTDAMLPKDIDQVVDYLVAREKSRKTVQQGQTARSVSTPRGAPILAKENKIHILKRILL